MLTRVGVDCGAHLIGAVAVDQSAHAFDRRAVRRDLALEVHPHLSGSRQFASTEVERCSSRTPDAEQLHRGDAQSLLVVLGRRARRSCRNGPTDIEVMGAVRGEADERPLDEDRRDHRHIGQVRAAAVRVVEQHRVAGRKTFVAESLDRVRRRTAASRGGSAGTRRG